MTFISVKSFTHLYETHEITTFKKQVTAAINLSQSLGLTRSEDMIICASQKNQCQENWHGHLILSNTNELIQDFGTLPITLTIHYDALYPNDRLLVQNHGQTFNDGTFSITTPSGLKYQLVVSQQGLIT
jgi:hypothetical protein